MSFIQPPPNFQPQINNNNYNKTEMNNNSQLTDREIDERIVAVIKYLKTSEALFKYAKSPYYHDRNSELVKHELSLENFVIWFDQVANRIESEKKYDPDILIEILQSKIIDKYPFCPAKPFAQISQKIGQFVLKNALANNWMLKNGLQNIPNFTEVELFMFVHGAQKTLPKTEMRTFLSEFSQYFSKKENLDNYVQLLSKLGPQGFSCLLKAHVKSECKESLTSQHLVLLASKKIDKFPPKILVDLIVGLDPQILGVPESVMELLEKIEEKLIHKQDPQIPLDIIMNHFVSIRYIPHKFLAVINKKLMDDSFSMGKKIALFFALACLGLKDKPYPYMEYFKILFNTHCDNNFSSINHLEPRSLLFFLFASAVFLQHKEKK